MSDLPCASRMTRRAPSSDACLRPTPPATARPFPPPCPAHLGLTLWIRARCRAKFSLLCIALLSSAYLHTGADLATAESGQSPDTGKPRPAQLLVVCVGGMDSDPTPEQRAGTARRGRGNSGLFQLCQDLHREQVAAEYFNWNGTRAGHLKSLASPGAGAIAGFVNDHLQAYPGDRLALVGNSWGGHTALQVAGLLRTQETPLAIEMVVFLDASSAGRDAATERALPDNVNRAVHYFTRNAFVWGRWDAGSRLENIDLGKPDGGFLQRGGPAYDSPFNFRAHVAAEWDDRIHADMQRRLIDLIPVPRPLSPVLRP